MQPLALIVAAVSALLFGIHITAGERQVARPMLASPFDPVARWTMYVCWHAVSLQLLLATVAAAWIGMQPATTVGAAVLMLIGALYLGYAILFVVLGRRSRIEGAWLKLGQWIAFAPAGAVALWAAL